MVDVFQPLWLQSLYFINKIQIQSIICYFPNKPMGKLTNQF